MPHPNDSRGKALDAGRKFKRFARKNGMSDPVYVAHTEGEALAHYGPKRMPARLRRNPYPPGRRHDAWQEGYDNPPL